MQEGETQINHQSTGALPIKLQNHLLSTSPILGLQDMQEKDYFEHLFNNEMWEIIVSETNHYYEQQKA